MRFLWNLQFIDSSMAELSFKFGRIISMGSKVMESNLGDAFLRYFPCPWHETTCLIPTGFGGEKMLCPSSITMPSTSHTQGGEIMFYAFWFFLHHASEQQSLC